MAGEKVSEIRETNLNQGKNNEIKKRGRKKSYEKLGEMRKREEGKEGKKRETTTPKLTIFSQRQLPLMV